MTGLSETQRRNLGVTLIHEPNQGAYGAVQVFKPYSHQRGRFQGYHRLAGLGVSDEERNMRMIQALMEEHENLPKLFFKFHHPDSTDILLGLEEYDLRTFMEKRDLSGGHKRALTQQMLKGLIKLHSVDIPHRNMNPYNIFLTNRGILKLGVFGADPGENIWNTHYRAPEQHLGLPYTKKVDLWALAVIHVELLVQKAGSPVEHLFQCRAMAQNFSELPSTSRQDQLKQKISDANLPSEPDLAFILTLLRPQPEDRASATAALAWLEQEK